MENIAKRIKELEKQIKRLGNVINPLRKVVSIIDKLPILLTIATVIGILIFVYTIGESDLLKKILGTIFLELYVSFWVVGLLSTLIESFHDILKDLFSHALKAYNSKKKIELAEQLSIITIIILILGVISFACYFFDWDFLLVIFFPSLILVSIIEFILLTMFSGYLTGIDVSGYKKLNEKYVELNSQLKKLNQAKTIANKIDFHLESIVDEHRKGQFIKLKDWLNSYYKNGMPSKKNMYSLTDRLTNDLDEIEDKIKRINAETSNNDLSETPTKQVAEVKSTIPQNVTSKIQRETYITSVRKEENIVKETSSATKESDEVKVVTPYEPLPIVKQEAITEQSNAPKTSYNFDFVSKTLDKVFAKKERKERAKAYKVEENLDSLFITKNENEEADKKTVSRNYKTENLSGEDYIAQAKEKQRIGLAGELFVVDMERKTLIQQGLPDLAKKVKHEALVTGNYLGFDILSYDVLGNEKYIEVKTSTGNYTSNFFLTKNELDTINKLGNYFIYRVYDFDVKQQKGSLYTVDCKKELNTFFELEPMAYSVKPRIK
jgi:hypothetical protein